MIFAKKISRRFRRDIFHKKEIEKRTRELLEQQQNSVLQGKKKDKVYNFETIKDKW